MGDGESGDAAEGGLADGEQPAGESAEDATAGDTSSADAAVETAGTTEGGRAPESGGSLRAWVGRRRRAVAVVAGLVVVAVVAAVVVFSSAAEDGPADLVQRYLDAIHSGDTRAALDIAGGEPETGARLDFLSADALADDWTVDEVVERHRLEDEADVDVTISGGGQSAEGRFHVVRGDDGWTIEEPFVAVDLPVRGMDVVELGGLRRPLPTGGADAWAELLVFPGAYELYPGFADRLTVDPALLLAPPQPRDTSARVTPAYALTDKGKADAQRAVDDFVAACAAAGGEAPTGCPFSMASDLRYSYDDVQGVTWTLVSAPVAHFVLTDGALQVIDRKPGVIRVAWTGIPDEPEGSPRGSFTAECEFSVEALGMSMTAAGFTVIPSAREAAVELGTRCY